jgi:hypothetical protein
MRSESDGMMIRSRDELPVVCKTPALADLAFEV